MSGVSARARARVLPALAFIASGCATVPTDPGAPYLGTSWLTAPNSAWSPTSTLSPTEAAQLANIVAARLRRPIIVSRVTATGSMRPYFDGNAVLLLEATPYDTLKVGDVVTFYHPELKVVVIHRLIDKRGSLFWSRGDHNGSFDTTYVTPQNYRLRLVGVVYARREAANASENFTQAATGR